jgi:ribonucleoside-triphosphate reductase
MYLVVKRDGNVVNFDLNKIKVAITKAFEATQKDYDENIIDFISLKVTADFSKKVKKGRIAVEQVQDSVEKVLSEAGYFDVA